MRKFCDVYNQTYSNSEREEFLFFQSLYGWLIFLFFGDRYEAFCREFVLECNRGNS